LQETEQMLAKSTEANSVLKNEMQLKDTQIQQIKTELTSLSQENEKLTGELGELQAKLKYLAGDVKNMEESRMLIALYKDRMKLVKGKINNFKVQARDARIAALQERDKTRILLGNNGFFMKAGKPVIVDEAKFNEVKVEPVKMEAENRKIKIDVNFFEP